jgi:CheY-like chemotaxis protein
MPSSTLQYPKILLVDDSEADRELLELTLLDGDLGLSVVSAADGVDALGYLLDTTEPLPKLIVLDWNMPRLDGRGLLLELRARAELGAIPVVVFTSSDATKDVVVSYACGASCFVTKPVGLVAFQDAVRAIRAFWVETAKLPVARRGRE